jgi:hypothetical protein
MCIICVDYELGKLTFSEALRNLNEMIGEVGEEHAVDVFVKIASPKDEGEEEEAISG